MTGHRSTEAKAYRKWYGTSAWKRIRRQQLLSQPLCKMCRDQGVITAATVCDHREPHKGDQVKFLSGPFDSLCAPCHNRHKQRLERTGTIRPPIGSDGWPLGGG